MCCGYGCALPKSEDHESGCEVFDDELELRSWRQPGLGWGPPEEGEAGFVHSAEMHGRSIRANGECADRVRREECDLLPDLRIHSPQSLNGPADDNQQDAAVEACDSSRSWSWDPHAPILSGMGHMSIEKMVGEVWGDPNRQIKEPSGPILLIEKS